MRRAATGLAAVASVAILALGLRAFLDPVAASVAFGLPMHTEAETTFVRVYGVRNAFLGAVALSFIALGMGRPLALLFSLATVLPLLDAVVIVSRIGFGHELVRHGGILCVLLLASASLWRANGSGAAAVARNQG